MIVYLYCPVLAHDLILRLISCNLSVNPKYLEGDDCPHETQYLTLDTKSPVIFSSLIEHVFRRVFQNVVLVLCRSMNVG